MKIRAITSFFDPALGSINGTLGTLSRLSTELTQRFEHSGYKVQSSRLATSPFPDWLKEKPGSQWPKAIHELETLSSGMGFAYTSVGPALPDFPDSYRCIPSILAENPNTFTGGVVARDSQVFPSAVQATAQVILDNSTITLDGFTNLRFAALANVKPYTPFLPVAYAKTGSQPAFALAIECADEAVIAFTQADSLESARNRLITSLEKHASQLSTLCCEVSAKYGVEFKGFDFSPAPFPEDWCSLGKAFELLGVSSIGESGSLTAAAFIADTLDRGTWQKTGFNGLMLAVMEDSILAKRVAEGKLTVKDLLLYSSVCGTGLDTIPLAGDTPVEALTGILLDLGSLSIRLAKPLTGRLMPVPGKRVGDETTFDFGFFANSRVMSLDGCKIDAPLFSDQPIHINPRETGF
jgi:uncharacterized protein (UPF0210 family)